MGQKSRWTLPVVLRPPAFKRYVVCVPDERFYRAAFEGLLVELTYSKNWQRNPAHSAAIVSRVWLDALANLTCDDCPPTRLIEESEYEMSLCEQLRWQGNRLQALCCGVWTDIPGTGPAIGGTVTQPPAGGDLASGECRKYTVVLSAQSKWLAPVKVGPNFRITVSGVKGAAADGGGTWFCPDGTPFVLGACVGSRGHSGGDPSAVLYHMSLLAEHAGAFYNANNTVFTTPGGAPNADLTLYLNDGSLPDNSGSITCEIEICNQAVVTTTHVFDFTTGMHGWTITDDGSGTAVYVPGSGFKSNNPSCAPGTGAMTITVPNVGEFLYVSGSCEYTASAAAVTPSDRNVGFGLHGAPVGGGNLANGSGPVHTDLVFMGVTDEITLTLDCDTCPSNAIMTGVTVTVSGSTDPWAGL